MRQYEVNFIVDPVLSNDEIQATAQNYVEHLKNEGCEIIHLDEMGLRQLAYTIRKRNSGVYYCIEFNITDTNNVIDKLELALRRDERIIRFLTVQLDKYGVKYNDDKRKGLIGKKKRAEEVAEPASQSKSETREGATKKQTVKDKPEAAEKSRAEVAVKDKPEAAEKGKAEVAVKEKPEAAEKDKPETVEDVKPEAVEEAKPEAAEEAKPETAEEAKSETAEEGKSETAEEGKPEAAEEDKPEAAEEGKTETNEEAAEKQVPGDIAAAVPISDEEE